MEKIFSTILRQFKMGKFFGEKIVLDLIFPNGVVQNSCPDFSFCFGMKWCIFHPRTFNIIHENKKWWFDGISYNSTVARYKKHFLSWSRQHKTYCSEVSWFDSKKMFMMTLLSKIKFTGKISTYYLSMYCFLAIRKPNKKSLRA